MRRGPAARGEDIQYYFVFEAALTQLKEELARLAIREGRLEDGIKMMRDLIGQIIEVHGRDSAEHGKLTHLLGLSLLSQVGRWLVLSLPISKLNMTGKC